MAFRSLYCLLLSLCLTLASVAALANLDVSEPIVRKSPAPDGDFFGFAVVLHQVEDPADGDMDSFLERTRLVIGAPRGTYPGGLDLPIGQPVNKAGLVYQCPIRAGSCSGLTNNSDPDSDDRRLFDGDPNFVNVTAGISENKTEQLMGSVLASKAGIFVACAPRWVFRPDNLTNDLDPRRPVGRCYVAPRNLKGFNLIMPCSGVMALNPVQTFMADSQCLTGFSASILEQQNSDPTLILGLIGDNSFNGNLFYYNVSSATGIPSNPINTQNVAGVDRYDGYSTTTGFITNTNVEDSISAAPRFNGSLLTGIIRVRSRLNGLDQESVISGIEGMQTGEYFGYCVATADLNNDNFDEIIVGAPMYSTRTLQEIGRVYVFENINGTIADTATPIFLFGNSMRLARFGSCITSLGDVNGDGFEDIAVGSPYESNANSNDTGAVYIYYGKSSGDGLISMSPDQVLLAKDIVNFVPNLTLLRTFGFSLSSSDVDGNKFNDLLIGAYESQTAVLIRSLSVAFVDVDVSTVAEVVSIDLTGSIATSFLISVCASYMGRGLDRRSLNTTLTVFEVVSVIPRLYFGSNSSSNEATKTFAFDSTNVSTCMDVEVFVRSISQLEQTRADLLVPLQVRVTFSPLPRRTVNYIGGDPQDLIDYRSIPVIRLEGDDTVSVRPSVNCSMVEDGQEVCRPDLVLTPPTIVYPGRSEGLPGDTAVVGAVGTVNISLSYKNDGEEPALGSVLSFTVPDRYEFERLEAPDGIANILCRRLVEATNNFTCSLPNFIPPKSQETRLILVWELTGALPADVTEDVAAVSIATSTRDMDTAPENNFQQIIIEYSRFADLGISTFGFIDPPVVYGAIATTAGLRPPVDQLGQRVRLSLNAVNQGPSPATGMQLDVFIPTNDEPDSYYIYLFEATIRAQSVMETCVGPLNPDDLPGSTSTDSRRRRSSRVLRQTSGTTPAPQMSDDAIPPVVRNCSRPDERSGCSMVSCSLSNFAGSSSLTVTITAFLDGRFFQSQTAPFTFEAFAMISSATEDVVTANNQRSTRPIRVSPPQTTESGTFPIWIPIVCSIVAVILIILLSVFLRHFGFFRRKKRDDQNKQAEGDFEPPVPVPAGGDVEGTPVKTAIVGEPVKPAEAPDGDIGDTDDLQNGSTEKPDVDPEETSL